jgi:pimeloyl-ACP methyl ester carboxylesterase
MNKRNFLKSAVAATLAYSLPYRSFAQSPQGATVKLSGAQLYYETRGSGPLLLMIPGGALDAGIYADVAQILAGTFTVVTYDPRGNSRSKLDGEPADQNMDVHADDAVKLIETLGQGPAYVFGSSGGAQIGLNLAARHPQHVRKLVAHEPPCLMLLPDPAKELASDRDIHDTYLHDGVEAAMGKFMAASGMGDGPPPAQPTPEAGETFARINGNLDYFFGHGILPLSEYVPDIAKLREEAARVAVGAGAQSEGQVTFRTSVALAEKLGLKPVIFPGDHMGYVSQPDAFAAILQQSFMDS